MSVGRLVGWLVTHSFDDPHVAPYWPTWPCYRWIEWDKEVIGDLFPIGLGFFGWCRWIEKDKEAIGDFFPSEWDLTNGVSELSGINWC